MINKQFRIIRNSEKYGLLIGDGGLRGRGIKEIIYQSTPTVNIYCASLTYIPSENVWQIPNYNN